MLTSGCGGGASSPPHPPTTTGAPSFPRLELRRSAPAPSYFTPSLSHQLHCNPSTLFAAVAGWFSALLNLHLLHLLLLSTAYSAPISIYTPLSFWLYLHTPHFKSTHRQYPLWYFKLSPVILLLSFTLEYSPALPYPLPMSSCLGV